MAVLTGADGQLLYGSKKISKCRDWQISVNRDALEITCLASNDRTYVEGLRGSTGSATLLYDPDELTTNQLLNTIFTNDKQQEVSFVLNKNDGSTFRCDGFLTSVSPSVSVGSVSAVSINFQINGT